MEVNFELYKVFYHAAKKLSYTKAAEALFISQSAVSQSIKLLEEQLNIQLFVRAGKGVKLTTEGEALFAHVEKAYNLLKSGEQYIDSIRSLSSGLVRVGASDTINKYFLLEPLKHFHEKYPNIRIQINNRPSPVSLRLVENGEIDLGVINLDPKKNYSSLKVVPLGSFRNVFIAPAKWKNALSGERSANSLSNYALISLEEKSTTRRIFNSYLKDNSLDLTPEFEFGSMDLIVEMTRIGMGIGFVAEAAAKSAIDSGEVFILDIKEPIPTVEIGLVSNPKVPMNLAAKAFAETLLDMLSAPFVMS